MIPLLAANWKMNPSRLDEAVELAQGVGAAARGHAAAVDVAVFPPYPWLVAVAGAVAGTGVGLGAQDCYWQPAGAFTGEVSAAMLAGWCEWVIVGHSERRTLFGETDDHVARKAQAALEAGLRVIVCVGEREAEHLAGETERVVSEQLRAALAQLAVAESDRMVIAYEPVWAIGTGHSARPEHAHATMGILRRVLEAAMGPNAAAGVRLLYGGSVNAGNVSSYVELPVCDGCLVGGASLKLEEFRAMIEAVVEVSARP